MPQFQGRFGIPGTNSSGSQNFAPASFGTVEARYSQPPRARASCNARSCASSPRRACLPDLAAHRGCRRAADTSSLPHRVQSLPTDAGPQGWFSRRLDSQEGTTFKRLAVAPGNTPCLQPKGCNFMRRKAEASFNWRSPFPHKAKEKRQYHQCAPLKCAGDFNLSARRNAPRVPITDLFA